MFVVGVFIVPSAEFIFFLICRSVLCGQHCTRAVFHQSDSFEYSLKFLLKSSYLKCPYIFIFAKLSYTQRNPVIKNFKTKINPSIISVTLTPTTATSMKTSLKNRLRILSLFFAINPRGPVT